LRDEAHVLYQLHIGQRIAESVSRKVVNPAYRLAFVAAAASSARDGIDLWSDWILAVSWREADVRVRVDRARQNRVGGQIDDAGARPHRDVGTGAGYPIAFDDD
jgi:hypothetical protein